MTNPKRLREAIELKKLFAVPWLLASDILFSKHDFLVRVYGHTEVKKQQEKAKKPIIVNAGGFLRQQPDEPMLTQTSLSEIGRQDILS